MKELLNKVFLVKHDPWLDANNKQFPLLPEVPVINLKRKFSWKIDKIAFIKAILLKSIIIADEFK